MAVVSIAAVGDNCIDRFLPPLGFRLAGGNAVNVAVQAVRLGCEASYFGAIGADEDGNHMRRALRENQVGIDGLVTDETRPTAYTDIVAEAGGERRFVFEEFGACAAYRVSDAGIGRLMAFDHVHIGWLNDGGALKRKLWSLGKSVSQDLSVNNTPENLSPEGLSIAFASAESARAREAAEALLNRGAALAVVTMGVEGSLATDGRQFALVPASPIMPLDTTGAGDSFIAAFLKAHVLGADMETALRAGAEHARCACLHLGGFPQEPLRDAGLIS